jgi:hypothetical protein
LYLDLDGNGVFETVVLSTSLPESGKIRFGNISDPLNGGTLVPFDNRPVFPTGKYRFTAETMTVGNTVTAQLSFTTEAAPTTYIPALLPNGRHKIKWIFSDQGGSTTSCSQNFHIVDCKKPTVVCINGMSINLISTPPPSITIFFSDFLQYGEDNVTGSNNLVYGVRKSGTGTGFPVDQSVTYDCSELGTQGVELWAMDQYGNADYCELYVLVMDNFGFCPGTSTAETSFCVRSWCDGALISGIDTAYVANGLTQALRVTDPPNCSDTYTTVNSGSLTTWMVKKDDMLNGLTVADAVKMLRHILGIEDVNYPYGRIAADLDGNQAITVVDAVTVLRLLVGLPTGTLRDSWTIVDSASIALTTSGDPYQLSPYWHAPNPVSTHLNVPFTAIKTGDLDCDALPGFVADETEDRDAVALHLPNLTLQAGETVEVPLTFVNNGQWLGLQLGLRFDPALISVTGFESTLDDTNFGAINTSEPGTLNLVWLNSEAVSFPAGTEIVRVQLKANAPVQLKNVLSLNTDPQSLEPLGYDGDLAEQLLILDFVSGTTAPLSTLRIMAPSPNPVNTSGATIRMVVEREQPVTLSLYDINGRAVFSKTSMLATGENSLLLPATAFSAGSGVYVWRVSTAAGIEEGKLVKM